MQHARTAVVAFALLAIGCTAPESARESQQVVVSATRSPKVTSLTSAATEPPAPSVSEPPAPTDSERDVFAARLGAMTDKELWDFGLQRHDAMSENLRLTGQLELPRWE